MPSPDCLVVHQNRSSFENWGPDSESQIPLGFLMAANYLNSFSKQKKLTGLPAALITLCGIAVITSGCNFAPNTPPTPADFPICGPNPETGATASVHFLADSVSLNTNTIQPISIQGICGDLGDNPEIHHQTASQPGPTCLETLSPLANPDGATTIQLDPETIAASLIITQKVLGPITVKQEISPTADIIGKAICEAPALQGLEIPTDKSNDFLWKPINYLWLGLAGFGALFLNKIRKGISQERKDFKERVDYVQKQINTNKLDLNQAEELQIQHGLRRRRKW